MTVSRVVNNKGEISTTTRQRVQEVIDRLGYRPSHIARSLATDRTATIGLVVPDNANPFFSEIARGVEHLAHEQGYNVFLCNTDEDAQREIAVLRSLEEKRVDGVILCSSRLDADDLHLVLAHHEAVVLINRRLEDAAVGMVLVDDASGAYLATQHLLARGHRAIGFLAGPRQSYSGQQRQQGYCAALHDAGIAPPPVWIQHCPPMVTSGKTATLDLLAANPELTALVCFNDLTAVGALQACANLGRRVPDDLAITGTDDIPLAALVTPPLTTCRVPMYELGRQAMRGLLARIGGESIDSNLVLVRPELVIRASAP
ncbi:MAG: LacI family transcriptional regulator [Chloroflexi bacterium]|nr:LacI family transcriptional regulator [Chloroflexota bacterium]